MWIDRVSGDARALEVALAGGPVAPGCAALVGFSAALASTAPAVPVAHAVAAGRERLMAAVAAAAEDRERSGMLHGRAVAVTVAAVAGGGLLVASAATGTDPVALVRDTVKGTIDEIPVIIGVDDAPHRVKLDGVLVSVAEDGSHVDLQSGDRLVRVGLGDATRFRSLDGERLHFADLRAGIEARILATESAAGALVAIEVTVRIVPPASGAYPGAAATSEPARAVEPTTTPLPTRPAIALTAVRDETPSAADAVATPVRATPVKPTAVVTVKPIATATVGTGNTNPAPVDASSNPTATPAKPNPPPTATATPSPTATPAPPTKTATPKPAATPVATTSVDPAPTATPVPAADTSLPASNASSAGYEDPPPLDGMMSGQSQPVTD